MTKPDTARFELERDITESLLRLKLARSQRDHKETRVCEKRMNWLLDRLNEFIEEAEK